MEEQKKTILLVDDDPLIIRMYQVKLSNDGYDIEIATNGEEALIAVRKHKPDLILLDLMMPRMNGIETLKSLKGDAKTKNIPVVVLTNLEGREEDISKAKELGALEYIIKSTIDLKELSQQVASILGD